jgi:hypothetical protein
MFNQKKQFQGNSRLAIPEKQFQRWSCAPHKALRQFQTPIGIDEKKRLELRIFKAIPQFQTFPPKGGCAWLELPPRTLGTSTGNSHHKRQEQ